MCPCVDFTKIIIVNLEKLTFHRCMYFLSPLVTELLHMSLVRSAFARKKTRSIFDVLLTVHLSIFISVFNQLDAQNLFHNKFYFMPLHVSSTFAHHQEVKIALHNLWYHHTYRCDDTLDTFFPIFFN